MKKNTKRNSPFFIVITGIVITVICMIFSYIWMLNYNKKEREISLSQAKIQDGKLILSDFIVEIKTRGGDSGAWLKDPIYDEEGNELHGASVGTIYEVFLTNTSGAILHDWKLELIMPEYMWLNNVWNGSMEIRQTTSGKEIVQEVDLGEYTKTDIILDYYVDHTGPMVPMNPGDSFVYISSEADNEKPLSSNDSSSSGKSYALIGFIVYIPDQTIDYIVPFKEGKITYILHKTIWDIPAFVVFFVIFCILLIVLFALVISQIRVNNLLKEQRRDAKIIKQSISTFINFIEAKDPNTKGHSQRVAKISRLIAGEMGYSELECNRIYYVALMHDCGKISIPVTILQKPDKLTAEEYEIIKNHTVYGDKMLRDFNSIEGINLGALYHHERYDGKGYPSGIAGEDIPLIARIICVADSFDAMNSNRCYRPKLSRETILRELIDNKGKQFDATIVDILIGLIEQGQIEI